MIIKKYMMMEGNKILMQRNEVRYRIQKWIAMALIVKICKIVDQDKKLILERH